MFIVQVEASAEQNDIITIISADDREQQKIESRFPTAIHVVSTIYLFVLLISLWRDQVIAIVVCVYWLMMIECSM